MESRCSFARTSCRLLPCLIIIIFAAGNLFIKAEAQTNPPPSASSPPAEALPLCHPHQDLPVSSQEASGLRLLIKQFYAPKNLTNQDTWLDLWEISGASFPRRAKEWKSQPFAPVTAVAEPYISCVERTKWHIYLHLVASAEEPAQSQPGPERKRVLETDFFDEKWSVISETSAEADQLARNLTQLSDSHRAEALNTLSAESNLAELTDALLSRSLDFYGQNDTLSQGLAITQDARALAERLTGKEFLAAVTRETANTYRLMNNYEDAVRYSQDSLTLARQTDDSYTLMFSLAGLALLQRLQGEYYHAMQLQNELLQLASEPRVSRLRSNALTELSKILFQLGDYQGAIDYAERSLQLAREKGKTLQVASALNSLCYAYPLLSKYSQALATCQESMTLAYAVKFPELATNSRAGIGQIYFLQGQYRQAIKTYQDCLTDMRQQKEVRPFKADLLTFLAQAYYANKQPDKAWKISRQAISTGKAINNPNALWRAYFLQGRIHNQKNKVLRATRALESSVETIESLFTKAPEQDSARQLFFQDKVEPYRMLVSLFLRRGQKEKAWQYAENAKAKTLKDILWRGMMSTEELNHARITLNASTAKTFAARMNCALAEFVVGEKKTFLFLLTGTEISVLPIKVTRQALKTEVDNFRKLLRECDYNFSEAAQKLYQRLFGKAGKLLPRDLSLVIIPDGPLWELPFQALKLGNGKYLWDEHPLFYAQSAEALQQSVATLSNDKAPRTLLGVGNPALPPEAQLPPLPGAELQVQKLGNLYGPEQSRIYIGPEATKERVKDSMAQYNILHFATHGIVNNANPMSSYLALASSGKLSEGALQAKEIKDLKLGARLAVLAACDTANGRFSDGEGIIGLTWALAAAGCPTTIASQWEVKDDSTEKLMTKLHQILHTPGTTHLSTAEALRQAAQQVRTEPERSHPYYWAGFIVVGDGLAVL